MTICLAQNFLYFRANILFQIFAQFLQMETLLVTKVNTKVSYTANDCMLPLKLNKKINKMYSILYFKGSDRLCMIVKLSM